VTSLNAYHYFISGQLNLAHFPSLGKSVRGLRVDPYPRVRVGSGKLFHGSDRVG
jgi:hypothetical protein